MNAKQHIEMVHELLARLAAGESLEAAAATLGIQDGSRVKVRWLGRAYPQVFCAELGAEVLAALYPSHLEVAAALPPEQRGELLRRAAAEGLSVRALKAAIQDLEPKTPADGVVRIGGVAQLEGAARALDMYTTWDDERLARVLNGANGGLIRRLARAGARLTRRISEEDAAA